LQAQLLKPIRTQAQQIGSGGGLLGPIINGSQQRQQAASAFASELALLIRGKAMNCSEGRQVQDPARLGEGACIQQQSQVVQQLSWSSCPSAHG